VFRIQDAGYKIVQYLALSFGGVRPSDIFAMSPDLTTCQSSGFLEAF
jgi:hypothetical protein